MQSFESHNLQAPYAQHAAMNQPAPPPYSRMNRRRRSSIPELITEKVEDSLDVAFKPFKKHLGMLGRFLIVATFLEDTLRLIVQFDSQTRYLRDGLGGNLGSQIFIIVNIIAMTVCSGLAIAKKYTEAAVTGLALVVVSQAMAYGMIFNLSFILRNLAIIGGLVMIEVESLSTQKQQNFFPAIFQQSPNEKRSLYLALIGRVLLIFLVFSLVTGGSFSFWRIIMGLIGSVAAVLIAVGFKAKWSALFLIVFLSVANVVLHGFWGLNSRVQEDYQRFNFFQTLSVMGGLMLLLSVGPGKMSVDEKRKRH